MAGLSKPALKLAHALMRQGIVEDDALHLARAGLNSFPSFKNKNASDFMAVVDAMNANSRFATVKAARQGMRGKESRVQRPGAEKEIRIGTKALHYTVYTTLPAGFVKELVLDTLQKWIDFARGQSGLGGRRLRHPSGRYGMSLQAQQTSDAFYTIYSDSPHADALETGHARVDLKQHLSSFANNHGGNYVVIPLGQNSLIGYPPPRIGLRSARNVKRMRVYAWGAKERSASTYGKRYGRSIFRTMTTDQTGRWIIPPMRAYHAAWHLQQKLQREINLTERLLQ